MVTFPAPPQHPVALGCCRSSARPRRGSSTCRHQAPTCSAGLSAPDATLSSPCPTSPALPPDSHQETSTPRRFLQSFSLTWRERCCPPDVSTWGQDPGSSWGKSPHPCTDMRRDTSPETRQSGSAAPACPSSPENPKHKPRSGSAPPPAVGLARLLLSQASFWHKASQALATVGPVPVTNPVASGPHPASRCAGIEHLLLVVTCRSPQT